MRVAQSVICLSGALLLSGCVSLTTHANPESVDQKAGTKIFARLNQGGKPLIGKKVTFTLADGDECGTLNVPTAQTNDKGVAQIQFTGNEGVENCVARISVAAEGKMSNL
ncbi:MAG: hypothetical protein JOZ48_14980, partial [Acidobacteriaceae bacterium]|nr:hypothetical protein [Acidobacteriaceae bacterium]